MRVTSRTVGFHFFYWTGVITALACIAIVLAGNTEPVYRFEHARFPVSWVFAGVTVISFLAAELWALAAAPKDNPEHESSPVATARRPEARKSGVLA